MIIKLKGNEDCRISLWIDGFQIHNEMGITPEEVIEIANMGGPFFDDGNEIVLEKEDE